MHDKRTLVPGSKTIAWVADGIGCRLLADGKTLAYCIDYTDAGGKRVRVFKAENNTPLRREADARAALAKVIVRKGEGLDLVKSDITIEQFGSEWFERQEGKQSTRDLHALNLRLHIYPRLGRLRVSQFNENHYRDLMLQLRRDGKSPSTIRNILNPLRQIVDEAVMRRLLAANPWDRVPKKERPTQGTSTKRILTSDEIATLLEAARPKRPSASLRLWALITLYIYSGVRAGEALGLTWDHVDFDGGLLKIRRQLDKKSGGFTTLKTRASTRDIPIAPPLRAALLEWRMQSRHTDDPGDFVFATESGTAWSHRNSLRAVTDLALTIGINSEPEDASRPNLDQHALRHVFASAMIRISKGDAERVARLTGHDDIQTLTRTYSHEFQAVRGGSTVSDEAALIESAFASNL